MSNSRQILFLKMLGFLHTGGKAIIIGFLPFFLIYRGFSSVEIGMIMGIAPLSGIVAQPIIGFLSDKYKTIKKILIGLHVFVFAAGFGIFFPEQFWIVFTSYIFMHFVFSPVSPLVDSMTIKSLGPDKSEYGKIRLWGSVGFGVVSLTSGYILDWIGVDKIYILFWLIISFTAFFLFFLKDQKDTSAKPVNFAGVAELFKNRSYLWFMLMCLIVMIPHRINDTMFVLHLEGYGGTGTMVGIAWALAAFSEVPIFYYVSKKIAKYKDLMLLGIVAFFYSIRWVLYSIVVDPWMIVGLQISQGITFGLFWLVAMQMTVRIVPDHLRSTGQSMLTSISFGLGGALGGTTGGWILDWQGSSTLYQLMAGFTFIAVVLIFISHFRSERKSKTTSL